MRRLSHGPRKAMLQSSWEHGGFRNSICATCGLLALTTAAKIYGKEVLARGCGLTALANHCPGHELRNAKSPICSEASGGLMVSREISTDANNQGNWPSCLKDFVGCDVLPNA
jgi:hypothetical protein